ncbi:MAG: cell division protein ZapE [Rhizobiales bacterium]|nr:cell division protein ZapE [Hyphomicrobiales bacterium]
MPGTIASRYAALVAAGQIESDPAQTTAAERLAALEARLATQSLASKSSSLGWLFGNRERREPVRGLYLHGDVGRGKTMLMDMFFTASVVLNKRRVHFHEFMADVHERIHDFRQRRKEGNGNGDDAIALTAAAIAQEARLLCFDEFHVTDIADAMILGRLFTRLFDHGVIVVATSNVAPENLYKDGLNRALFLPFLALLERHMDIMRLEARTDYRLEKLIGGKVWLVPADKGAEIALNDIWSQLTHGEESQSRVLMIKGRRVHIPKAGMGIARFSFHDLCEQPLGATDYLRIAREFHTVLIDRIPVMTYEKRNEAKRFIALIDTLYDNAVKLIASAKAAPTELYRADEGFEVEEFKRTASRLIEMGSQSYLALPHGVRAAQASASPEGIIET